MTERDEFRELKEYLEKIVGEPITELDRHALIDARAFLRDYVAQHSPNSLSKED